MNPSTPARVAVELVGGQARVVDLVASAYLGPRVVGVDGPCVRVALVGICAMLLAHDDLRLEIEVGPGAHLELIEPSGTVAYDSHGAEATWTATVRVADRGRLVWAGAPFVVAHGAHVHRHTDLALDDGAAVLIRELVVLGRSGECGGKARVTLDATYDHQALLREDLDLRDTVRRHAPGILGSSRVVATTALLGTRPPAPPRAHETTLAGPGALGRCLATDAHNAEDVLAETWKSWHATLISWP